MNSNNDPINPTTDDVSANFIHDLIDEDLAPGGRFAGKTVHTRFPPEPNGYLHIGQQKLLSLISAPRKKYNGLCNLRMDDTNPSTEDVEYVEAIQNDIRWLGYDWGGVSITPRIISLRCLILPVV